MGPYKGPEGAEAAWGLKRLDLRFYTRHPGSSSFKPVFELSIQIIFALPRMIPTIPIDSMCQRAFRSSEKYDESKYNYLNIHDHNT
jgi:hypothetical protein